MAFPEAPEGGGSFPPIGEAGLYIHIPFCSAKCDYCDFYSIPLGENLPPSLITNYVDALLRDLEKGLRVLAVERVVTLYIGGGTPSLLGKGGITALLRGLRSLLPSWPMEVSVEANPESAGGGFIGALRDGGVSRLSMGIQSLEGESRRLMGRRGSLEGLGGILQEAAEAFPRGLNLDLMAGLPWQDKNSLRRDLDYVLKFNPGHISLYSLTLEEGTPLYEKVHRGELSLPPADEADTLWIEGRDALEEAGYGQYEVSNFALPGRESHHNIRYWHMESWLALGAGASMTLIDGDRAIRYSYPREALSYAQGSLYPTAEPLGPGDLIRETLMMGFRYREGPDLALFQGRFGLSLGDLIPRTLAGWEERGLLRRSAPGEKPLLALNSRGLLQLNRFLLEAFNELDERGD